MYKTTHFVQYQSSFFHVSIGKFYTWLIFFTQPAVVMVVTNMKYASTCVWTGAPCRPFRHSTDNYRCTWLWLNHNKARRSFGAEHYLTCTGHLSSNSLHCTSLHHGPDPKMEIQRTKRSITREQAAQLSARCWPQLTSFTKSPGWIWVATWMIFKPLECASPVLLHHAYGTLLCPLSF